MEYKYEFRKIRPEDKEPLVEIVKKIWGGRDFVQFRFDEWLEQEKGEFTAIEHNGKLVGCGKLDFLTETDAWLQALRKDVDADLKGVGMALTNYYIDKLRDYPGLTSIRFATHIRNHKSITANMKAGFRVAKRFSIKINMLLPASIEKKPEFENITAVNDADKVLDYIHSSPYFEHQGGFLHENWIVYPYSDEFIMRDFVNENRCMAYIEDDQIKALALPYEYIKNVSLSFFDADEFKYAKIMSDYLKYYVDDIGFNRLNIYIADYPKLKKWLTRLSFTSWYQENDFMIFEYPLENYQK